MIIKCFPKILARGRRNFIHIKIRGGVFGSTSVTVQVVVVDVGMNATRKPSKENANMSVLA